MKSMFPNQSWTDFALKEVRASGLADINPADAPDFLLDGTAESWVHLLAAMAKHESNFKPSLTYNEDGILEGVVSTGLLQLSEASSRAYAKFARNKKIKAEIAAATTESLKDPLFNIRVGVVILKRWVAIDGVVATRTAPWLGGARYWSVLRKGATKVKATLNQAAVSKLAALSLKPPAQSASMAAKPSGAIPKEIAMAYQARHNLGSNCNWIFEVDYSINSKSKRLFVYSIADKKLLRYKCAHGKGGKNGSPHDGKIREVSNVKGSLCTSLGVIRTGEPYTSDLVGRALRLNGLSSTNSNILGRGIVLHGGLYVHDNKAGTDKSISGRSEGCIVVDDQYIDYVNGGDLIEWLKNGSIGVTHYGGKFSIS